MIKIVKKGVTKYTTSDRTRVSIISSAGELAAEHGFNNVTTRMVADHSGENIGSIHYHFGGKKGLFEAVVLEAISGCRNEGEGVLDSINEEASREELAEAVRLIVSAEITDMFRSDRPDWQVPVIYQLLQREDDLSALFDQQVLHPSSEQMERLLKIIDPEMDDWDLHLHKVLMKIPIFAHADYLKTMLKMLNTDHYSEAYLQRMEDMIVKQTQVLLNLPLDKREKKKI